MKRGPALGRFSLKRVPRFETPPCASELQGRRQQ